MSLSIIEVSSEDEDTSVEAPETSYDSFNTSEAPESSFDTVYSSEAPENSYDSVDTSEASVVDDSIEDATQTPKRVVEIDLTTSPSATTTNMSPVGNNNGCSVCLDSFRDIR